MSERKKIGMKKEDFADAVMEARLKRARGVAQKFAPAQELQSLHKNYNELRGLVWRWAVELPSAPARVVLPMRPSATKARNPAPET